MTTQHFNLSDDKLLKQVFKAAFPDYNGRRFRVTWDTKTMSLVSYWSSGSRDFYALVNLSTMEVVHVPTCHPVFQKEEAEKWGFYELAMPWVVVCHHVGRYEYCAVYTSASPPLLDSGEGPEVDVLRLLHTTSRYKSSYAGKSDLRKAYMVHTFGYTRKQVDELRAKAIEQGYMTKRNALNNKGKNAVQLYPLDGSVQWREYSYGR